MYSFFFVLGGIVGYPRFLSMTDPARLLGKEDVRSILEVANERPMSIPDISDACDIPLSSTYHHVEQLVEADMLTEETRLDPDGNHYRIYETVFRGCFIFLEDGEIAIQQDVCRKGKDADRLIWLWQQLRDAKKE